MRVASAPCTMSVGAVIFARREIVAGRGDPPAETGRIIGPLGFREDQGAVASASKGYPGLAIFANLGSVTRGDERGQGYRHRTHGKRRL